MKPTRDLLAGIVTLLLGAGVMLVSAQYPLGTAARMGPGLFPMAMGGLLVALSLAALLRAVIQKRSEAIEADGGRSLVAIVGSIMAFALLVPSGGVVVAVLALVLIAALGDPERRWGEAILLAAVMAAAAALIFVKALNVPLKVWPL